MQNIPLQAHREAPIHLLDDAFAAVLANDQAGVARIDVGGRIEPVGRWRPEQVRHFLNRALVGVEIAHAAIMPRQSIHARYVASGRVAVNPGIAATASSTRVRLPRR